jgi:hypothetical protein
MLGAFFKGSLEALRKILEFVQVRHWATNPASLLSVHQIQEYFKDIRRSHVIRYMSAVSVMYNADPTPITLPISPNPQCSTHNADPKLLTTPRTRTLTRVNTR